MWGRNTLNLLLLYTVYYEANKTLKIAQLKSKTKGRYFITQENTYVDKNQDYPWPTWWNKTKRKKWDKSILKVTF